jgi:hypothetical protein
MRTGTGTGGALTRTRCSASRRDGRQLLAGMARSRIDLGAIVSGSLPTHLRVLPCSPRTPGLAVSDQWSGHLWPPQYLSPSTSPIISEYFPQSLPGPSSTSRSASLLISEVPLCSSRSTAPLTSETPRTISGLPTQAPRTTSRLVSDPARTVSHSLPTHLRVAHPDSSDHVVHQLGVAPQPARNSSPLMSELFPTRL